MKYTKDTIVTALKRRRDEIRVNYQQKLEKRENYYELLDADILKSVDELEQTLVKVRESVNTGDRLGGSGLSYDLSKLSQQLTRRGSREDRAILDSREIKNLQKEMDVAVGRLTTAIIMLEGSEEDFISTSELEKLGIMNVVRL